MLSENSVLGVLEFSGTLREAALAVPEETTSFPRSSRFRVAGARIKPTDIIGFLRAHTARARRRSLPPRLVTLEVVSPSGGRAVEICFQDS